MNCVEVQILKPGDLILYGDSRNTKDNRRQAFGRVLFVTKGGAARVEEWRYPPCEGPPGEDEVWSGPERFVPYHHIIRLERRAPDFGEAMLTRGWAQL